MTACWARAPVLWRSGFGPVGAVAGGVVGYTAGPNIATGLGVRHHTRRYHHRHVYRESRR